MSDDISTLKEVEKEAGESMTIDDERPSSTREHNNNWVAGIVLISIGAIFLFTNLFDFTLHNWWALFILIPAVSSFANAWRNYKENGRLDKSGRGSLTGGFILTLVASAFLFNLDWGIIWPIFLIVGGIGALLGGWFD